ncbi:MAG: GGDEF domain-containing protein [Pseudanabaena sp. ELA607]
MTGQILYDEELEQMFNQELNKTSDDSFDQVLFNPICSQDVTPGIALESTLKDLQLYQYQLDITTEAKFALKSFSSNPQLPGVLLMEQKQLVGLLSRRRILEQMSRPYGLELFLCRPLSQLYQYTKVDHLILPEDTLITEAVQQSLKRPSNLLDEPIVVEDSQHYYKIVDIHQLLVAHSRIFQLATNLLTQANQRLKELTIIDPLTGIGNRRLFDQYFSRDWHLAIREKQWITVILCDVDYFKKYNDTYGHQAGDDCLRQVAHLIHNDCKRMTDIVARYGGEEFIISLLNVKAEQAIAIVERIQKSLSELKLPHVASSVSPYLTLSFGIAAIKPITNQNSSSLIELADQALYQAKEKGRNQFVMVSQKKK